MAEKKIVKKPDAKAKATKKTNFFGEMKGELKRVSWPDRTKLIRSSAAVVIIAVAFALLIWFVDSLVYGGLNLVGFHEARPATQVVETTVAATEPVPLPTETAGE